MLQPPAFVSEEDAQRHFRHIDTKKAVLVVIRGEMYKHEADGWYHLDNKPRATVEEFIRGST